MSVSDRVNQLELSVSKEGGDDELLIESRDKDQDDKAEHEELTEKAN